MEKLIRKRGENKMLDLSFIEKLEIHKVVTIPKSYYQNTKVLELKDIKVDGFFSYEEEEEIHAKFDISGVMILEDDISLEPVEYPFSIFYDDILEENLKNDKNSLDLFEFLWENIVLEVPMKFTKVSNLDEIHGDGWKLISEEDHKSEKNPFADLLKDFDKKG